MARTATFTINISPKTEQAMYVSYATRNGTASAGTHYTSKSGDLTFAADEFEKTVEVSVEDDAAPGLTFYLDVEWQLPGLNTTSRPSGLCTIL
jgi:hypothetical protein